MPFVTTDFSNEGTFQNLLFVGIESMLCVVCIKMAVSTQEHV